VQFRSASILKGGLAVFNIGGNKYRLVVAIDYGRQACFVKFIDRLPAFQPAQSYAPAAGMK